MVGSKVVEFIERCGKIEKVIVHAEKTDYIADIIFALYTYDLFQSVEHLQRHRTQFK